MKKAYEREVASQQVDQQWNAGDNVWQSFHQNLNGVYKRNLNSVTDHLSTLPGFMIHTASENCVIIGLENSFSINLHQAITTYDNNHLECDQNLYVFIQVTWYLK